MSFVKNFGKFISPIALYIKMSSLSFDFLFKSYAAVNTAFTALIP